MGVKETLARVDRQDCKRSRSMCCCRCNGTIYISRIQNPKCKNPWRYEDFDYAGAFHCTILAFSQSCQESSMHVCIKISNRKRLMRSTLSKQLEQPDFKRISQIASWWRDTLWSNHIDEEKTQDILGLSSFWPISCIVRPTFSYD